MEEANGLTTCLGDGQTEAPGVLTESGRSDVLLWRMLPYLTGPDRLDLHPYLNQILIGLLLAPNKPIHQVLL